MAENGAPVKLSAHDVRLLSAAIAYTLGLIGTGDKSALFVNSLADSDPRAWEMLEGARQMLVRSKEGQTEDSVTKAEAATFVANLEHLNNLGILLSGGDAIGVEAEVEPVQVATDLDKDGREVGAKRYALWVTHDEIHLLHWALKAAESIAKRQPTFIQNGMKYAGLRSDLGEAAFDNFVTKFDNVHQQARIDDGEEAGVKSTPDDSKV